MYWPNPLLMPGMSQGKIIIFEAKKLKARHYELPDSPESPRVFISELLLEEFSTFSAETIRENLDRVSADAVRFTGPYFPGSDFQTIELQSIYSAARGI